MSEIKKDFGDWLSPMLVKEIRQGFRSRIFVFAFLLIQGLMIFCVVLGLIFSSGDFTEGSSWVFWTIICIPLLLIMPSHGFGVLGNEIKGNTIELLFLTRLSAWRIVVGKWTAIVAQTILIICSVLPYAVLRYFIGGVNLLTDLEALGWLLFASALLTGVTIAISPFYRSMLAKLFLPVLTLFLLWMLAAFLEGVSLRHASMTNTFLITAVLGPLFLLLMFEIAVARIAPPAENHSFRKRLLGFLILGAIALLDMVTADPVPLMAASFVLLLPVCVTALCEEIKPIPSIYLPFVKRGYFGRLAGLLFYPGWPSGFLFTIFAFVAYLAIFMPRKMTVDEDGLLMIISMGGAILMPLAVEKLFFERLKKTFVVYFALQAFMGLSVFLAAAVKPTSLSDWMKLASPFPTTVFILMSSNSIDAADKPLFTLIGALVLIVSLVILLVKSSRDRGKIAVYENIARDTLMNREAPVVAEVPDANAA